MKFKNLWNPTPETSNALLKRQETVLGIMSEYFVPIHEVQNITDQIIHKYNICLSERVIVGISGRSGSGKTCLANVIANSILDRTNNGIRVAVMPIDGYLLYRSELERMKDSEHSPTRRGSYSTFNTEKLYNDLVRIKTSAKNGIDVKIPSFDHDLKDPIENDITIPENVQIVIVEGNYLFYTNDSAWSKVCELFNLKIFIECDPMECKERLVKSLSISGEKGSLCDEESDDSDGDLIDMTKKKC